MATYYYIIEKIDGEFYNVGRARSEQEAIDRIAEMEAEDRRHRDLHGPFGIRPARRSFSYSTNRYDC